MTHTIYLLNQIQDLIDNRLEKEYSIIGRDEYISLLEEVKNVDIFSHRMREYKGYAHLNNRNGERSLRNILGRKIINGKMTWKCDYMFKILVSHNILDRTSSYSIEKKKNYGYKLSDDIIANLILDDLQYKQESINDKLFNKLITSPVPTDPKLKMIYDFLKSDRVTYDIKGALTWTMNELINNGLSFRSFVLYNDMAYRLFNKQIFVIEGDLSNRIFTSFNTIKRELRQFLKIDGEKLLSTDLKTSQPFMFASNLVMQYPNLIDAKNFYDDVTNDDIYTIFLNQWKAKNLIAQEYNQTKGVLENIKLETRDNAKPEFLRFMFKKGNQGVRRPFDIIFEERYPTLYKKLQKEKTSKAADLQKLEASIFIPISYEFLEEGCLSVHDSLYFKQNSQEKILNRLKETFEEKGLYNFNLK